MDRVGTELSSQSPWTFCLWTFAICDREEGYVFCIWGDWQFSLCVCVCVCVCVCGEAVLNHFQAHFDTNFVPNKWSTERWAIPLVLAGREKPWSLFRLHGNQMGTQSSVTPTSAVEEYRTTFLFSTHTSLPLHTHKHKLRYWAHCKFSGRITLTIEFQIRTACLMLLARQTEEKDCYRCEMFYRNSIRHSSIFFELCRDPAVPCSQE